MGVTGPHGVDANNGSAYNATAGGQAAGKEGDRFDAKINDRVRASFLL